jgi:hypothetical protein
MAVADTEDDNSASKKIRSHPSPLWGVLQRKICLQDPDNCRHKNTNKGHRSEASGYRSLEPLEAMKPQITVIASVSVFCLFAWLETTF